MSPNDLRRTSFIYWDRLKKKKISLKVPVGYKFLNISSDGEVGFDKQYHYQDSSILYISDLPIHLNYNNMLAMEGALSKDFVAYCSDDTITIEGQDLKGFYWKNKRIGKVCLGYMNASKSKKDIFDIALNNIKMRW